MVVLSVATVLILVIRSKSTTQPENAGLFKVLAIAYTDRMSCLDVCYKFADMFPEKKAANFFFINKADGWSLSNLIQHSEIVRTRADMIIYDIFQKFMTCPIIWNIF